MEPMRPIPLPPNRRPRVVEGYVVWYDSRLKMQRRGTHEVTLVASDCGMAEVQPGNMIHLRRHVDRGWWVEHGAIPCL